MNDEDDIDSGMRVTKRRDPRASSDSHMLPSSLCFDDETTEPEIFGYLARCEEEELTRLLEDLR